MLQEHDGKRQFGDEHHARQGQQRDRRESRSVPGALIRHARAGASGHGSLQRVGAIAVRPRCSTQESEFDEEPDPDGETCQDENKSDFDRTGIVGDI